jgi:hypothetical protein
VTVTVLVMVTGMRRVSVSVAVHVPVAELYTPGGVVVWQVVPELVTPLGGVMLAEFETLCPIATGEPSAATRTRKSRETAAFARRICASNACIL